LQQQQQQQLQATTDDVKPRAGRVLTITARNVARRFVFVHRRPWRR